MNTENSNDTENALLFEITPPKPLSSYSEEELFTQKTNKDDYWKDNITIPSYATQEKKQRNTNKSDSSSWTHNAIIADHPNRAYGHQLGYREAAETLTNHIRKDNYLIDAMVYPVIFLYRHAIELYMKDLIEDINKTEKTKQEPMRTHELSKIWENLRKSLEKYCPEDDKKELDAAEKIIMKINEFDIGSTSFRYPTTRGGGQSLSKIKHINILYFSEVMSTLFYTLDYMRAGVYLNGDHYSE